jgi:anti-sigma-K factor RskA
MNDNQLDPRIARLLEREQAPPPFPKDEVKVRIAETLRRRRERTGPSQKRWYVGPLWRPALAAAAAVLVFVAGAEYGRRTAVGASEAAAVPAAGLSAPISIQSAGSRYVARLAEFTQQASTLTPEEREEARQVAVAILYAATMELLQDQENDELLNAVARLVWSKRQALSNPGHPDAVWF